MPTEQSITQENIKSEVSAALFYASFIAPEEERERANTRWVEEVSAKFLECLEAGRTSSQDLHGVLDASSQDVGEIQRNSIVRRITQSGLLKSFS